MLNVVAASYSTWIFHRDGRALERPENDIAASKDAERARLGKERVQL